MRAREHARMHAYTCAHAQVCAVGDWLIFGRHSNPDSLDPLQVNVGG